MPKVKELYVNGKTVPVDVDGERSLLSVLRDDLDLTGAKYGCGEGQCGACTVLLDGVPVRSCVTPARAAQGKQITTIEGLEHDLAELFSKPIPRAVWRELRSVQNHDVRELIDRLTDTIE